MTPNERRLRHNENARNYRNKNKEKVAALQKRWYEKNKDHVYSYNRARQALRSPEEIDRTRARDRMRHGKKRAENREAYNERLRIWSNANPDKIRSRNYKWTKNNRDTVKAAKIKRRAPSGANPFTADDIKNIRRLQMSKCGYCRIDLTPTIEHIDHIIALANGGTNDRRNIQLLCAKCNKRKAKRDPITFAQSLGNLL